MKGHHAGRTLFIDHHGYRAAFDTFAERESASTGKRGVRKALQHVGIILQQRFDLLLELLLRSDARVLSRNGSVASDDD